MHIRSIPRHQIDTTLADYGRMGAVLLRLRDFHDPVRRFERRFAEYVGTRHAIAVSSGRLALHLVLKQLDIEPSGEAVISAFNYFAVVERFLQHGLRPAFADVRSRDLNLNPEDVARVIRPRTRVLLATHMFGHPCDMDALASLARERDLILIEDCAHGFGTRFVGRHVGTFGRAGVFSLSVMKLVTAFGGGVVTTDNDELAERIRRDLEERYHPVGLRSRMGRFLKGAVLDLGTRTWPFSLVGWPLLRLARMIQPNFQQQMMTETPHRQVATNDVAQTVLDPFQAVLGLSQIDRAADMIHHRRMLVAHLDEQLGHVPGIQTLRCDDRAFFNGIYYGILADEPQRLMQYLFARGIDSESAEYRDCSRLDIYREFARPCPVAREVERCILRLPLNAGMTSSDVVRIAQAIRSFMGAEGLPVTGVRAAT